METPIRTRKNEGRRTASLRGWASDMWQYVLLVIVVGVTVLLVSLAMNRPLAAPSSPTPGPELSPTPSLAPSPTPSQTPIPSPTPTPGSGSAAVVAFIGDSYTAGSGASEATSRWSTLLATANGWIEVNLGVDGAGYGTPGDGGTPYASQVERAIAARPDIVIVSGGRFDYSGDESPSEISTAITATFASLRAGLPDAQIIAIGPIWDATETPARVNEIEAEVRQAAEDVSGTFVDVGQPLAYQPNLIEDDGILPNDAGHVTLTATIGAAVNPVVSSAESPRE